MKLILLLKKKIKICFDHLFLFWIGADPTSVSQCGVWANVASPLTQKIATFGRNKLKLLLLTLLSSNKGKCRFSEILFENSSFIAWMRPVENNRFEACCTLCKKTLKLHEKSEKHYQIHLLCK